MSIGRTYAIICEGNFLELRVFDSNMVFLPNHSYKLLRATVGLTVNPKDGVIVVKGLDENLEKVSFGVYAAYTYTGCEGSLGNIAAVPLPESCPPGTVPSQALANLYECLRSCSSCCGGSGGSGGGSNDIGITIAHSRVGDEETIQVTASTTEAACIGIELTTVVTVRNAGTNLVVFQNTYNTASPLPATINLGDGLPAGTYAVNVDSADCAGNTASEAITFVIPATLPPTASVTYNAQTQILTVNADTNLGNLVFNATLTIFDITSGPLMALSLQPAELTSINGTPVFVLNFDNTSPINTVDVGSLNLPNGQYTAQLVVTDSANQESESLSSFSIGSSAIPPTVDVQVNNTNTALNITAASNDSACAGAFTLTLTIVDLNTTSTVYSQSYNQMGAFTPFDITFLSDGVYTATVSITDCTSLISTDNVSFTINSSTPTVNVNIDLDTSGAEDELDYSVVISDGSCSGVFTASLVVTNSLNNTVLTIPYTNLTLPASVTIASLGLAAGTYTATLNALDCNFVQGTDSVNFTVSSQQPPLAQVSYNGATDALDVSAASNDPACDGDYTATLIIRDSGNTQVDTFAWSASSPINSIPVSSITTNGPGTYSANLTVNDCTNLPSLSTTNFVIGSTVLPPSVVTSYNSSSQLLAITAASNDASCSGNFSLLVTITNTGTSTIVGTYPFTQASNYNPFDIGALNLPAGNYEVLTQITDCTSLSASDTETFVINASATAPTASLLYDNSSTVLTVDADSTDASCSGEFTATLTIKNSSNVQVFSQLYTQASTLPATVNIGNLNLPDDTYTVDLMVTDCTNIPATEQVVFSIVSNQLPPSGSIAYNSSTNSLDLTGQSNDASCGGDFTATLEIRTGLGVVIDTLSYTNPAAFPSSVSLDSYTLADGGYVATLVITDCITSITELEFFTIENTPPTSTISFNVSTQVLTMTATSNDADCSGNYTAVLEILNSSNAVVFAETWTQVDFPGVFHVIDDVSPALATGSYTARLTVTDCINVPVIDTVGFDVGGAIDPTISILVDNPNNELDITATSNDASCSGNFAVVLNIEDVTNLGTIITTRNFTQADFMSNVLMYDWSNLNLPGGNYRATATITDCVGSDTSTGDFTVVNPCTTDLPQSHTEFIFNLAVVDNLDTTVTYSWALANVDPCNPPTGLASTGVTNTQATITWTAPTTGVVPDSYNVQYRVVSTTTWTTINVTASQATLTGLSESTSYEVQVQSVCATGSSTFVGPITFSTANAPVSGPIQFGMNTFLDTPLNVMVTDDGQPYGMIRVYANTINITGGSASAGDEIAINPSDGFNGQNQTAYLESLAAQGNGIVYNMEGAPYYLADAPGNDREAYVLHQLPIDNPSQNGNGTYCVDPNNYSDFVKIIEILVAHWGDPATKTHNLTTSSPLFANMRGTVGPLDQNIFRNGGGIQIYNEDYEHWEGNNITYTLPPAMATALSLSATESRKGGDIPPEARAAWLYASATAALAINPSLPIYAPSDVMFDPNQFARFKWWFDEFNGGVVPSNVRYAIHHYQHNGGMNNSNYTQLIDFGKRPLSPDDGGSAYSDLEDLMTLAVTNCASIGITADRVGMYEIGYDQDHRPWAGSGNGGPLVVDEIGGFNKEEVASAWLTRCSIHCLRTGMNEFVMYEIRDSFQPSGGGREGGLFATCGLYIGSSYSSNQRTEFTENYGLHKKVLQNTTYLNVVANTSGDGTVKIDKFDKGGSQKIYTIYKNTSSDSTSSNITFNVGVSETVVELLTPNGTDEDGTTSTPSQVGQQVTIPTVNEEVQYLIVNG